MSYLASCLPRSGKKKKLLQLGWGGLHEGGAPDTGELADCRGLDPSRLPEYLPHGAAAVFGSDYGTGNILSVHGFENILLVFYKAAGNVMLDYYSGTEKVGTASVGSIALAGTGHRSVTRFNVYQNTGNVVSDTYARKLLIFPDRLCMDLRQTGNFILTPMGSGGRVIPELSHVTSAAGRLWGVKTGKIYASGYNDYANWNLDTASESLASNAWLSASQTNTGSDEDFTGIAAYDGHILGFKKHFLHQVCGTKNPFRLTDVGDRGANGGNAMAVCHETLYFAGDEGIFAYRGGYPVLISEKLSPPSYAGAILCGRGDSLYCYLPCGNEDRLYLCHGETGAFTRLFCPGRIVSMTVAGGEVLAACGDGRLYRLTGGAKGSFSLTTALYCGGELTGKTVTKLQLYCSIGTGGSASLALDGGTAVTSGTKTGEVVLTVLLRGNHAVGHAVTVSGSGDVVLRYLELEYEERGN